MSRKRTNRRQFLGAAAAGGVVALAGPGRLSARSEPLAPMQDRPIVVRGGSVEIEFDEQTYKGAAGRYTGAGKQIARVTFTRPNGKEDECSGTGPVTVRCTNPRTTITIQNSGPNLSLEFDEGTFMGTAGSNHRRNADAVLVDLRVGGTTCFNGRVTTITVRTT